MNTFTRIEVFMIIFRFLEINFERCKDIDVEVILSGMSVVDDGEPFDSGTVADFEQAITDLQNNAINMAKFKPGA